MEETAILAARMYSTEAPAPQLRHEIMPTLLVSWWCTCFSLAFIFIRITGRYIRTQRLFPEDWVMLLSIIPLLTRMGFVHVVLIWGTNNVISTGFAEDEIWRRQIGSGLVLAARIFYALFIWTAKFTVSEFLKRLTSQIWRRSSKMILHSIRLFLAVTFIAVVVATLAECQPFHHYWQVSPTPEPKCRQGYAHLIVMGACDVITDLLLVAFPIPIIIVSSMPAKRKVYLTTLFAMSLVLVGITCYRVPAVIERHGNQQYRSLFASLEILAATVVSNAIVIGSFVRDKGVKKQKYKNNKLGSVSEASDRDFSRRATITHHRWGSDADLATELGMRLDPELQMPTYQEIRPAPAALPSPQNISPRNSTVEAKWDPSKLREEDQTFEADPKRPQTLPPLGSLGPVPNQPPPSSTHEPNVKSPTEAAKVSLNDVGGLLASRQSSATASTIVGHETGPEPQPQRSQSNRRSRGFFEIVSNFLGSPPQNSSSEVLNPQPVARNFSRPLGGSERNSHEQCSASVSPEPTPSEQDPLDDSITRNREMRLNDPGNLLEKDLEKNAPP
ncbi:hypothetical protein FQN50_003258 [Emmonsiellopsis sp. PD_5]|nr:hypothetical protein FQN50_003258 [Emmonsiellopsis sp. PD_5]